MRLLSRIIILFLCFQGFSFADTALPACGFSAVCPDGLVCVGSTGTANDGQCILTGPSIALCTTAKLIKQFSFYFEIFSVVALGFAFFLGKISWGMIISVILGIAVIEGAVPITKKLAGDSAGYCSTETISYSNGCKNATWSLDSASSKMNTTTVYNTDVTALCPSPMSCTKRVCKPMSLLVTQSVASVNAALAASGFPTVTSVSGSFVLKVGTSTISSQVSGSSAQVTDYMPASTAYFVPSELIAIAIADIPSNVKFSASCTNYVGTSTNYLACKNSCTGNTTITQTSATSCSVVTS